MSIDKAGFESCMPVLSAFNPALPTVVPMPQFHEVLVFGFTEVISAPLYRRFLASIAFGARGSFADLFSGQIFLAR